MLAGLPNSLKEEFSLKNYSSWAIASLQDCTKNDEIEFSATVKALEQFNKRGNPKDYWRLLASLLHLGNIKFVLKNDMWETYPSDHLNTASRLLGLDPQDLLRVITIRNLQAGSNILLRPCSSSKECEARRDTLVKLLYRLTFDHVLDDVNEKLKNSHCHPRIDSKHLCNKSEIFRENANV